MMDSPDLQSYPAGVERGTSIDDSSISCRPCS